MAHHRLGLQVHSLFDWHPNDSDTLSRYILSLKNGQNRRAWSWIVSEFLICKQKELQGHNTDNTMLIPAPAKKLYPYDHAYFFAKALSDMNLGHLTVAFPEREIDSQYGFHREKARNQRLEVISRQRDVNISVDLIKQKQIVFVDDVVTTGSTARQAYQALGKPERFTVWSLASRALLAEMVRL